MTIGTRRSVAMTAIAVIAAIAFGCSDSPQSPAARGERLATKLGCRSCHTVDGRTAIGPSWQGLAGSTVVLDDGSRVVADDAYLTRSIVEPQAQRVAQFATPMPALNVAPDDIAALVAYIKSIE